MLFGCLVLQSVALSPAEAGLLSLQLAHSSELCFSFCYASAGGRIWSLRQVLEAATLNPDEAGSLLVQSTQLT